MRFSVTARPKTSFGVFDFLLTSAPIGFVTKPSSETNSYVYSNYSCYIESRDTRYGVHIARMSSSLLARGSRKPFSIGPKPTQGQHVKIVNDRVHKVEREILFTLFNIP